jgi:uncharacterized protein (TIGR02996 family)
VNLEDAFVGDILRNPQDATPKLVYADWLDERGRPDLAFAYRWMATRGRHPGLRQRPRARKPWAWWHERSLAMEYPAEHDDIRRSPGAFLPLLVFRAMGPEDVLAAHAYYRTVGECVQGLANALKRLRDLVDLEG